MELDTRTMKQFLEDAGADDIEEEAAEELASTLELFIGYITEEAAATAEEKDRKVVTKQDIEQALA